MLKWYKNRRISVKLIIAFLIVAVLAGVVGAVGLINIVRINDLDTQLYENNAMGLQYAGQMSAVYQRLRYNVLQLLLLESSSDIDAANQKIDDMLADLDTLLDKYVGTVSTDEEKALADGIEGQWITYQAYVGQFRELVDDGDKSKAQSVLLVDAKQAADGLRENFDALLTLNAAEAKEKSDNNEAAAGNSIITMIILLAAAILLSILLGVCISRLIGNPLVQMTGIAGKLAAGDVEVDAAINTEDEIGQLGKAFGLLISNTKEQANIARRIAEGDLTADIAVRSEKDLLGSSLAELLNKQNQIVETIVLAAGQVAAGSNMVSTSSMALSQGASEQASSIEELTASLEEIAAQVIHNAENAKTANDLAKNAEINAVDGNTQMHDMLSSMIEINESSGKINKIIKVIDDIAFQTNILALNAAVEAARAGQHGLGFAVVAEEVRSLAARSANAAKETTDLIEDSIKKVEAGTKIANSTAAALNQIVEQVKKAAVLVNDISVASTEQSGGIEQINQGITQISQVVQTNAATSEESAAASEELSGQAAQLKEIVSIFKLKRNIAAALDNPVPKSAPGAVGSAPKAAEAKLRSEIPAAKVNISISDGGFGKY